jgi:hypothetical protein
MILPHDDQNDKESMLMPLIFTSYKNYLGSSKIFSRRFELDGGFKNLSKTN